LVLSAAYRSGASRLLFHPPFYHRESRFIAKPPETFVMLYRKTLALLICLAAAAFSCTAGAKTLVVNNGMTAAADTNVGTTAAPYKTISAAVQVAQPGDTVTVMAGTYTELTSASDVSIIGVQVREVGTAAAPVMIQAQSPGSVIINQNSKGVGFEIMNSSYVTINGFVIQNCYGGGIHMEEGAASNHVVVENNTINHCDGPAGGNVGGIYIGGCTNCTITNNSINDIKVGGVYYMNAAGIHGYSQANCTLSNNLITNAYTGIFHKRSSGQTGLLITNNSISGVTYGIMYSVGGAGDPPHENQRVFNNIINASSIGIYAPVYETSSPSQGLTIQHNVFLGGNAINEWGYDGVVVQDNIFYNLTADAIDTQKGTWKSELTTMSNNLFYTGGTFYLQEYGSGAAQYSSVSSFLSATGFPATNKVANPMFVAPTSSNYQLASGSPAIGAAHDGTNIGAYPTGKEVIGLLSAPTSTSSTGTTTTVTPDPPSNVSVQ
jgi:parallel beta-helix repeat protein